MDFHAAVRQLMQNNRRETDGHSYTVPSPSSYPYQWLWDSCFHSVILTHIDVAQAKDELRSTVVHQRTDGFIGHVTYWQPGEIYNIKWEHPATSSITQPPLLAYAVQRIFAKDGDIDFVAELYPHIANFHRYLLARRAPGRELLGIVNPDESGEDNSPRFDEVIGLPSTHDPAEHNRRRFALYDTYRICQYKTTCMRDQFLVEDVPFNTFFVWNTNILAELASELGYHQEANEWRAIATQTGQAMRRELLKEDYFVSLQAPTYTPTRALTWSIFCPLLAKLYTPIEAKTLIQRYLHDPYYFQAAYGIPTVAMSDPAFDPTEPTFGAPWQHPHWRGPIWTAVHWCIFLGLNQYGYHHEANKITGLTKKLIIENGFREYYHPATGLGMGAEDFTWSGLVLDMLPHPAT